MAKATFCQGMALLRERRSGEKRMDRLQFEVPVRITPAPGLPIEEIYSVEQALDFLQGWPVRRQGPVYQAAFNACFGATVDLVKTEDAWRAFMAFCRVSSLLARDMLVPCKRGGRARGVRARGQAKGF
jgi:hypothetical protein